MPPTSNLPHRTTMLLQTLTSNSRGEDLEDHPREAKAREEDMQRHVNKWKLMRDKSKRKSICISHVDRDTNLGSQMRKPKGGPGRPLSPRKLDQGTPHTRQGRGDGTEARGRS